MEPSDSGETFWMLLSLLVLPVEEQVRVIGGLPETASKIEGSNYYGDPYVFPEDLKDNNAILLLSMLATYSSGWLDEFDPDCPMLVELTKWQEEEKLFLVTHLVTLKTKTSGSCLGP